MLQALSSGGRHDFMRLAACLALLLARGAAADSPWPSYRGGPGLAGRSAAAGPTSAPIVFWASAARLSPQTSDGSLVISGGRVFVATSSATAQTPSAVFALDASSGAPLSEWAAPPAPPTACRSTLAVSGGVVLRLTSTSSSFFLTGFSATSAAPASLFDASGSLPDGLSACASLASSPLPSVALVTALALPSTQSGNIEDVFYGFDSSSGAQVFYASGSDVGPDSPRSVEELVGFSAVASGAGYSLNFNVIVQSATTFPVTGADGQPFVFDPPPNNVQSAVTSDAGVVVGWSEAQVWAMPLGSPQPLTLTWLYSVAGGRSIVSSSVAIGAKVLYALTAGSNNGLLALDLSTGAHLWEIMLGADAAAAPVVDANDVVFVASTSILLAYNAAGVQLWYRALSDIVLNGETVVALAMDGQGSLVLALDSTRLATLGVLPAAAPAAAGLSRAAIFAIAGAAGGLCVLAAAVALCRSCCDSGGSRGGGGGFGGRSHDNPFGGGSGDGGGMYDGGDADGPYRALADAPSSSRGDASASPFAASGSSAPAFMASGSHGWGAGVN